MFPLPLWVTNQLGIWLQGLVTGLARHFKVSVEVEHPICKRKDSEADHCEFLLAIRPNA